MLVVDPEHVSLLEPSFVVHEYMVFWHLFGLPEPAQASEPDVAVDPSVPGLPEQ
jgi:hypothetical protein